MSAVPASKWIAILRLQLKSGKRAATAAFEDRAQGRVWVAPALQVFSVLMAAVRQYCRVFGLFTQPVYLAAGHDEFRKQGSYRLIDLDWGRDIGRSVLAFG